jgi:histidine ammonia-lyase
MTADVVIVGARAAGSSLAIHLARQGRKVIAIELLCAAEALEYQRPMRSGAGVERAFDAVRTVVPRLQADRSPAGDIRAIEKLIAAGRLG